MSTLDSAEQCKHHRRETESHGRDAPAPSSSTATVMSLSWPPPKQQKRGKDKGKEKSKAEKDPRPAPFKIKLGPIKKSTSGKSSMTPSAGLSCIQSHTSSHMDGSTADKAAFIPGDSNDDGESEKPATPVESEGEDLALGIRAHFKAAALMAGIPAPPGSRRAHFLEKYGKYTSEKTLKLLLATWSSPYY
ncbi:hypothetical protein LXA43DRAFT_1062867 [Ganoderma leucocontextum]|nr:hypothetical protein LXA43DRAFT_1062867 [Ganoderma leucocontextum]